jgi:hypothetical protein
MDSLSWHFRKEYINYKLQYENAYENLIKNTLPMLKSFKSHSSDKKSISGTLVIVALTLAGGLIISLMGIAFIESKQQKKNTTNLES